MILAYRFRVRSRLGELNRMARAVDFVWNYCNDVQRQALKWGKKWPTGFDLNNLTAGSSKMLGLPAQTINAVCNQYVRSRRQHKRPYLRWRGKKSLGWIPIRTQSLFVRGDDFEFAGSKFRVFLSRRIPPLAKIVDGSTFARDTHGNWFLNVAIEVPDAPSRQPTVGLGIDLGLKDFAALSNGEKIGNPRHLAGLAEKLGNAQRAGKKRQVRNIHARIQNARRDFHHKASTGIVERFDHIAVGNINAAGLAKTSLAKSVLDAGWSSFRAMLAYKAIRHGAVYQEVSERFTTVTCSACGSRGGPSGLEGVRIREWRCDDCGTAHDRDTNAAINILRRGRATLVAGVCGPDDAAHGANPLSSVFDREPANSTPRGIHDRRISD